MAVSNIKALIPGELQKVWDLVLDIENYGAWRSDLSKAEVISDKKFIEYTKEGYGFYGAGIRVNPKTNELLAMYLTGDYQKNLLVRFNAATGEKISEIAYDGYCFPATFIFN